MQYEEKPIESGSASVYRPSDAPASATAEAPKVMQIKVETTILPTQQAATAEAAPAPVAEISGASSESAAGGEEFLGEGQEKTMTEKVKEILIDTAHVAKEKILPALHVAYEKLHVAGVAAEDKAAQALKSMGHAQQVKAAELEQDAGERRVEVAGEEGQELPKSPGILTRAYNKLHDAGVAVEEKAAQIFKNLGHAQQNKATELEEDAGERREESFVAAESGEKGVLEQAKEKVQDAAIATKEKVQDAAIATKEKVQDVAVAAKEKVQDVTGAGATSTEGENKGILEKASDAIQSTSSSLEDSAARALREMGGKAQATASDLQWDASQRRRTPTPGRISPEVLESFGVVSANLEEKAARMREAMKGREIDVDAITQSKIHPGLESSAGWESGSSASFGTGSSSLGLGSGSTSLGLGNVTHLPKEVPPPEERKVIPDPVD